MKISKSIIKCILVFSMILTSTYVYAINIDGINNNEEVSILKAKNAEVTLDEKIELIISLDSIQYDNFILKLKPSEELENPEIHDGTENDSNSRTDGENNNNSSSETNDENGNQSNSETDDENNQTNNDESEDPIDVEENNNEITIQYNKENSNLSMIELSYEIPNTVKVGDTIKFEGTVANAENEEEKTDIEAEVKIVETKSDNNDNENDQSHQDNENEGSQPKNDNPNNQMPNNGNQSNNNQNGMTSNSNMGQMNQSNNNGATNSNSMMSSLDSSYSKTTQSIGLSGGSASSESTVTYNGSDNNYLSSLEVEGYNLNKTFAKDNSTYFVSVDSSVESLNITANVEDSTATVCVYGNEDLETGTNKVLITVTAENGNTRTYRVYITKK